MRLFSPSAFTAAPNCTPWQMAGLLVRTGAENRVLSGTQVQQIANTRMTGNYEAEPVPGATRDDLDPDVLREFMDVWQERQGRPITRPIDDVLVEMGWILPSGQPTVAGVLLFGKNPSVFIPRCGITFVRFEGVQVRKSDGDRSYGRRVEVNGHLADVIKRTWDIIQEEIRTRCCCARIKAGGTVGLSTDGDPRGVGQCCRPPRLSHPRTGD